MIPSHEEIKEAKEREEARSLGVTASGACFHFDVAGQPLKVGDWVMYFTKQSTNVGIRTGVIVDVWTVGIDMGGTRAIRVRAAGRRYDGKWEMFKREIVLRDLTRVVKIPKGPRGVGLAWLDSLAASL